MMTCYHRWIAVLNHIICKKMAPLIRKLHIMSVVGFAYARTCWRVYMVMEQQQQLFSRWSSRQMELKPVPATSLRPPLEYIITRLSQGQKPDRDKLDRERRDPEETFSDITRFTCNSLCSTRPEGAKTRMQSRSHHAIPYGDIIVVASFQSSRASFQPPPPLFHPIPSLHFILPQFLVPLRFRVGQNKVILSWVNHKNGLAKLL